MRPPMRPEFRRPCTKNPRTPIASGFDECRDFCKTPVTAQTGEICWRRRSKSFCVAGGPPAGRTKPTSYGPGFFGRTSPVNRAYSRSDGRGNTTGKRWKYIAGGFPIRTKRTQPAREQSMPIFINLIFESGCALCALIKMMKWARRLHKAKGEGNLPAGVEGDVEKMINCLKISSASLKGIFRIGSWASMIVESCMVSEVICATRLGQKTEIYSVFQPRGSLVPPGGSLVLLFQATQIVWE